MSTERNAAPAKDVRWFRRRILRAVIVVFAGLLLFYSKLTFDLTPWALVTLSAFTTATYPKSEVSDTRVLLFTDEDLTMGANKFPIGYDMHKIVLSQLLEEDARPSALFIDFAFVQPQANDREGFESLRQTVCELSRQIPVFVVDTVSIDKSMKERPFGPCAKPVGAFVDDDEPGGGAMTYPACGVERRHPHEGFFDRVRGIFAEAESPPCPGPVSAAYAMWNADPSRNRDQSMHTSTAERMSLVWPARVKAPQESCAGDDRHLADQLLDLYLEGADAFKGRCPYTSTITVGQLLRTTDQAERAAVSKALQGKPVFYGAKIALSGDVINSISYKDLPGVYYHAMAFDNLLSFDGRPKHETSRSTRNWIALFLASCGVILAFRAHGESHDSPSKSLKRAERFIGVALAIGVITLIGLLYGTGYLLAACLSLYIVVRLVTSFWTAMLSIGCFVFALGMYWRGQTNLDIYFSMILFFEVVHLMLHHLSDAAAQVHQLRKKKLTFFERTAVVLLDPFMPD